MLDKLNALYEMSGSRIRHEFEGKVVILKNLGDFSPIYIATIGKLFVVRRQAGDGVVFLYVGHTASCGTCCIISQSTLGTPNECNPNANSKQP